jgi:hypothetical protein
MSEGLDERARRAALNRAVELQSEVDRRARDAQETAALREAAREVGVEPEVFDRAAAEVAEQARAEARAAADAARGRSRAWALAAGAAAVAAVGLGGVFVVGWATREPPAPPPVTVGFEGPAGFGLDASPGTRASLRFAEEAGRGRVAVVEVDGTAPAADGTWHVNLDATEVPANPGAFRSVSFDVKGSLPNVRLYLEVGADERWRSPPIAVGSDWTRREVPLTAFEHQVRRDGAWKVVGSELPERLDAVSFKVGHYVNPPDATGDVWLDDLTWR